MFNSKKLAILVVLVMIAPIVLAACGATPEPETIIQTVVVEQTKIVVEEGEEVTIIETVEVEVPAEPAEVTSASARRPSEASTTRAPALVSSRSSSTLLVSALLTDAVIADVPLCRDPRRPAGLKLR